MRTQLRELGHEPKIVGVRGSEDVKEQVTRNNLAKMAPDWNDVLDRDVEACEIFKMGEVKIGVLTLPDWS